MFRSLPAIFLTTALVPLPLTAQEGPSLLELIRPERLLQHAVQSGIMALRTQVDLKYSGMSVWLGGSRVALNDLQLWPLPDWDEKADCEITIDRMVLRGAALDLSDRYEVQVSAYGVNAPVICLPPDMRPIAGTAGLDSLRLPEVSLRMRYDIPSAGAELTVTASLADIAALELTARLPYLWLDARDTPDEPMPVAFLSEARLSIENLGGWEQLAPMIPPPFADPNGSPLAIEGLVGTALIEMNRDAAPDDGTGTIGLSDAQKDFVASVKQTWPTFLAAPQRLVLETGLAPKGGQYLDFDAYKEDPTLLFDDLRPRLALAPGTAADLVDIATLAALRSGTLPDMSATEFRTLASALLSGRGAPRDITTGTDMLRSLANDGDGAAALLLAKALRERAPEEAYRFALSAGAGSARGAGALLDRLEQDLSLETVLNLQARNDADASHAIEALESLALIRAEARARLIGIGQPRSYAIAAMWASIAAAAGDAEGAAVLQELDERARLATPEGAALWDQQLAGSSALAMEAWIERDMPARLGLRQ